MGKTEQKSESVSIISGSDGPTSIFLMGSIGSKKKTLKQRMQSTAFAIRKKWYALWIKPKAHTMDEVIRYVKENYNFVELSKDTEEYRSQYDDLRVSFIMQYEPELLGEYANPPKMNSHDEEGIREFQEQWRIRQQKAKEISDDSFPFDFHYLEKRENGNNMRLYVESRFGYIGGGFRGMDESGSAKFEKMYKDIYRYYGVTKEDIAKESKRYQTLIRTLARRV